MRIAMKVLLAPALACLLATPILAQGPPPTAASSPFPGVSWYRQPGVRTALSLTDMQMSRLNDAYDKFQTRYQEDVGRLARLNEAERAARLRELNTTYRNDLLQSFGGVLDNKQMARYRQLELQNLGWAAFNDPALQRRLTLTDEQLRALRDYNQQADRTYREIIERAATNKDEALKQYDAWQKESRERLNTLLNEQQRRTWTEMIGEPYNFPPTFERP